MAECLLKIERWSAAAFLIKQTAALPLVAGGAWYGIKDDFSIFHTGNFLPFHFHSIPFPFYTKNFPLHAKIFFHIPFHTSIPRNYLQWQHQKFSEGGTFIEQRCGGFQCQGRQFRFYQFRDLPNSLKCSFIFPSLSVVRSFYVSTYSSKTSLCIYK